MIKNNYKIMSVEHKQLFEDIYTILVGFGARLKGLHNIWELVGHRWP